MDRPIIYTGEIPRSTDVLNGWQQAMIGLGHFVKLVLGTSTWVEGLACTPQNPASMSVNVGPGQIYALDQVDASGYGSLAPNTLEIMKQGLVTGITALACPAPSTAGDSINYLIEAEYIDQDSAPLVLPYYNTDDPAQALSGPGNNSAPQNTIRQGVCNLVVKAGAAAATGSQTTPPVDSGYVGLWVVTVAAGATTITAPDIALYPSAPFWSGAAGLNQPNVFTDTQTIDLPAGFSGKALVGQLAGSNTFYVDQAGNFLTVGDFTSDGNLSVAGSSTLTGPVTVPNATASNQAVALGQVLNGVAPVAANNNLIGTTAAVTTGTLTAPCDGYALVIGSFSSGTGSVSGTGITASLAGLVEVVSPNYGNAFNQSVWYLPMTKGQSSTFTATLSQATSGSCTVSVVATFQPNPGT